MKSLIVTKMTPLDYFMGQRSILFTVFTGSKTNNHILNDTSMQKFLKSLFSKMSFSSTALGHVAMRLFFPCDQINSNRLHLSPADTWHIEVKTQLYQSAQNIGQKKRNKNYFSRADIHVTELPASQCIELKHNTLS